MNRSHLLPNQCFESILETIREKIKKRGDLPHVSEKKQLDLLDQLCSFAFGRFIIERKGANAFWTDYLISPPTTGSFTPLEEFFLRSNPIVLAHRERFSQFQKIAQGEVKEQIVAASVPCGVMRDLLELDFSKTENFRLFGVDLDPEALSLASALAVNRRLEPHVEFFQQDAWQLCLREPLDLLLSSGLNVYESNPEKLLCLYKKFFEALKNEGKLVISALTYPPGESRKTDWNLEKISPDDLLLNRILHADILEMHWRNFRSLDELEGEFKEVGFSKVSIYLDSRRIFPTLVAQK